MGDASLFLNAEGDTHPTQILYLIEPSYLQATSTPVRFAYFLKHPTLALDLNWNDISVYAVCL
jgi:hypothetical protein